MLRRLIGTFVLAIAGCKSGGAPQLQEIGDQVAVVGQQLTINLFASDPEGDRISFDFAGAGVPDLDVTTSLTVATDGHGVFTFTPLASQIGSQYFDFIASDGKNEDKLTILIEVKGAIGIGSLPVFRKPLGNGTVLDLEQAECVDVEIVVEDPDSTSVMLTQLPPLIQDAELLAAPDGLTGSWSWCPSREQIDAADRWDLALSAQDEVNPPTVKDYVIVLRKRSGENCPGEPPVISHAPMEHATLLDLPIEAQISDDEGLGDTPLLLYAYEDPGDPVDFSKLVVVDMELVAGDMQDGTWRGYIPNPTANQPEGTSAPVWYVVSASDDDDAEGDCDHITDLPRDDAFEITVTNNGEGDAGVCGHCSTDVQCGGPGNLCLPQDGGNFCGTACGGTGDCPEGFVCSPPVESVDGASGAQCIKNEGSCVAGPAGNCEDDQFEDDDDPEEGAMQGVLPAGQTMGTLCPGDDDWLLLDVQEDSLVHAVLAGSDPPDMDLALTDGNGILVDSSVGISSNEDLTSTCVEPGQYFLRVFALSPNGQFGDYSVTLEYLPCTEGGTGDCCTSHEGTGCEDAAVQSCVCDLDAFCCETHWDGVCAMKAANDCAGCGPVEQDCCTVAQTPGCSDAAVEACVCAIDSFCCETAWDAMCVSRVGSSLCAAPCEPDDADGACCTAHASGGCNVNSVETCVCNDDAFCCDTEWDQMCVDKIGTLGCGTCPG